MTFSGHDDSTINIVLGLLLLLLLHDFGIVLSVLFSPPKSPDMRQEDKISAEPMTDWSDPVS